MSSLVADLRDVLAEEVPDISVMELSGHSDQSIAETIVHQRAVRKIRALLGELLADEEKSRDDEPAPNTRTDRSTWQPSVGRQMTPEEYAACTCSHLRAGDGMSTATFGAFLGERESQVLHLIAEGLSNKEIARAMCIAEFTVKSHVQHLMRKLGATNRAHCISLAWRRGWLDLDRCQL